MATTETGMYGSLRYINTAKVSSVCVCKCLCLRSLCLVPLKAIVHPVNEVFESSWVRFGIRLLRWSCGPGSRAGRVKGNRQFVQRVSPTPLIWWYCKCDFCKGKGSIQEHFGTWFYTSVSTKTGMWFIYTCSFITSSNRTTITNVLLYIKYSVINRMFIKVGTYFSKISQYFATW